MKDELQVEPESVISWLQVLRQSDEKLYEQLHHLRTVLIERLERIEERLELLAKRTG